MSHPQVHLKNIPLILITAVVCMNLDRTKTPLDLINNVPENEYKLDSLSIKECIN